jgi:hypothetical protein
MDPIIRLFSDSVLIAIGEATTVSPTKPLSEKSKGRKSGELGGHGIGPPRSFIFLYIIFIEVITSTYR